MYEYYQEAQVRIHAAAAEGPYIVHQGKRREGGRD